MTVFRRLIGVSGFGVAALSGYPAFVGALLIGDVVAGERSVIRRWEDGPRSLATTLISDFIAALPAFLTFAGIVIAGALLLAWKPRLPLAGGGALVAGIGALVAGGVLSGSWFGITALLLGAAGVLHGAALGFALSRLRTLREEM